MTNQRSAQMAANRQSRAYGLEHRTQQPGLAAALLEIFDGKRYPKAGIFELSPLQAVLIAAPKIAQYGPTTYVDSPDYEGGGSDRWSGTLGELFALHAEALIELVYERIGATEPLQSQQVLQLVTRDDLVALLGEGVQIG